MLRSREQDELAEIEEQDLPEWRWYWLISGIMLLVGMIHNV